MFDLVGNPKDMFSHDLAHLFYRTSTSSYTRLLPSTVLRCNLKSNKLHHNSNTSRISVLQDQYEFLYKTVAQVLCLRSYPVDKENLKKEWKELRKDDGKLIQTTYEVRNVLAIS